MDTRVDKISLVMLDRYVFSLFIYKNLFGLDFGKNMDFEFEYNENDESKFEDD